MAHVLIVDDDEISRVILGTILQDAGHEVAYAGDGNAALARIQRQAFDAVITDLAMPEMNGLRLIQFLAETNGGTPVIAISGQNAEQLLLAEDYGAVATLFKPVNPELLLNHLEAATRVSANSWAGAWF